MTEMIKKEISKTVSIYSVKKGSVFLLLLFMHSLGMKLRASSRETALSRIENSLRSHYLADFLENRYP